MKFARLIAIVTILNLGVFVLTSCDTKSSPDKERPKKNERYSSRKAQTKQPREQKEPTESVPPVAPSNEPVENDTNKPGELATVTRIVDGDMIDVRFADGRTERVRYIGIDTWESWDKPHAGHRLEANRVLVEGKEVRLVKDVSERDHYDRLLRYVYVGNVFVNARLVEDGNARAKDYPPDSKHAAEFAELEQQAKAARKGCWVESTEPLTGQSDYFIGNRKNNKLHNLAHGACRGYVSRVSEGNKVLFSSEAEANAAGYYACFRCP